mmetsp:Transcript_26009/g.41865  ORF Transcript_26009/g.41865 Transcript_26009/m.41865 type:complete len:306 (+) Transcript_26009:3-920(+)|eukprot:jgi/Bigna1/66630/fgenesh1_pg.2_\
MFGLVVGGMISPISKFWWEAEEEDGFSLPPLIQESETTNSSSVSTAQPSPTFNLPGPNLTHVIVIASYFGANQQKVMRDLLSKQHEVRDTVLPGSPFGKMILVDNSSPLGPEVERLCSEYGIEYTRNEDTDNGFQRELGAWRWAVKKVLPRLPLYDDSIIYFLQDSMLARSMMRYPPPQGLRATRVFYFEGGKWIPINSWVDIGARAMKNVKDAPPFDVQKIRSGKDVFNGMFGPNFIATWNFTRTMEKRGVFDMLQVKRKLDEEATERILGWFLSHDVGDDNAIGGHFQRPVTAPLFQKFYQGR